MDKGHLPLKRGGGFFNKTTLWREWTSLRKIVFGWDCAPCRQRWWFRWSVSRREREGERASVCVCERERKREREREQGEREEGVMAAYGPL